MRPIISILLVLSLFVVLPAGCKDRSSSDDDPEIKIGEYGSTSGATATFGQSSHEGAMLAVEQINAAGGVLGKPIKIILEDDRSDANEAVTAVQKLISRDKVVAILGEVASKRSLAGAGVCQQYKVPCSRRPAPTPM